MVLCTNVFWWAPLFYCTSLYREQSGKRKCTPGSVRFETTAEHPFCVQTSPGGRYCSAAPHVTVSGEENEFIWNCISNSVSQHRHFIFNEHLVGRVTTELSCVLWYIGVLSGAVRWAVVNFHLALFKAWRRSSMRPNKLRLPDSLLRSFVATREVLLPSKPLYRSELTEILWHISPQQVTSPKMEGVRKPPYIASSSADIATNITINLFPGNYQI